MQRQYEAEPLSGCSSPEQLTSPLGIVSYTPESSLKEKTPSTSGGGLASHCPVAQDY